MTDLREGIENMEWTVTGKVKFIKFTAQSNKEDIQFLYDPMDRRIAKIVYNSPTEQTHTYYSHDAQGNVLATYKRQISIEDGNTPNYDQYAETFTLSDHHIYGSQRIGVENQHKRILTAAQLVPETGFPGVPGQITIQNATFDYTERLVGDKNYELSNHLGNVLNVITDRKLGITDFADVIDFEGPDPSVGSVQPCGDINHWYSNGGTNVSLQEMGANNTGWRIQHTLGNFGGSNINICQVIGEQYTLTVNVLEKSSNNITFVVRDYPSNSFITSQSLQLGQNTFTYTYTGANSGARLQFQITGAGYYVIDDLSISGAGMDVQYPGTAVYTADVVSYADYGPYGQLLDQRHGNAGDGYLYGFQGQLKDDEIKGEGNSLNYEYRMHDPRIGRFFAVDPLAGKYAYNSPYAFSENRLLDGVELEGLEWKAIKDDKGNYTNFEWDPDNAYNDKGKLKEGYFDEAILIYDKMQYERNKEQDPKLPSEERLSSFNAGVATITVFKSDGTKADFDGTSMPSDPSKFGTVKEGLYKGVKHKHQKKYWAIQLRTLAGSAYIPSVGTNPAGGGEDKNNQTVDGVNIHKAGKDSYTGTFWKKNKKGVWRYSGVSEGCQLIKTDQWDVFYACFNFNGTIGVIINRENPRDAVKKAISTHTMGKTVKAKPVTKSNEGIYDYIWKALKSLDDGTRQ